MDVGWPSSQHYSKDNSNGVHRPVHRHLCSNITLVLPVKVQRRGYFANRCAAHVGNSPFSPFAVVPLFEVTGLAETFPSFSVSGPFLLDFSGFQVPSDSIVPPQLWSSSRALPLHLHFCNCSDVFQFHLFF